MRRSNAGAEPLLNLQTDPFTRYRYESKQTGEQPLTRVKGRFTCRYAYGRSAETVKLSERGQDFMAFSMNDHVCCFVLCDGVGLSYRGDVAARFLGQGLLSWLNVTDHPSGTALERRLKELSVEAHREVNHLDVDDGTPKLLREVLREKQRMGSESMYICGRIELPTRFQRKGRLWLAWQGDSRVRLWRRQQEISAELGDRFRTSERWSTRVGPVGGTPNEYERKLELDAGYRLQLYSDGLNDLDPLTELIPDEQVQVLFNARHTDGLEDDASFLEIAW